MFDYERNKFKDTKNDDYHEKVSDKQLFIVVDLNNIVIYNT